MTVVRRESYVFDLLSPDGLLLRRLEHVKPGGHISGNSNARIRWSGSITYTGSITREQWYQYRIRPQLVINGNLHPLGVYVVRPAQITRSETGTAMQLDLYDRTFIPAGDVIDTTMSAPAGIHVSALVGEILTSTGEVAPAMTSSGIKLPSPMVWEAGTSKLTIINELLAAIGYNALWCDFTGAYRIGPYARPSTRPVSYTFLPGKNAIHLGRWVRTHNAIVPNKIVCISQETSNTPAMRAVALNEDPNSPYSIHNQGVWVAQTHTGIEAANQEVLDAKAQRYLASATPSATMQRSMLTTPIDLNSVVISETGAREVVKNIDYTLTPASLMEITSREVTS